MILSVSTIRQSWTYQWLIATIVQLSYLYGAGEPLWHIF